MTDIQSRTGWAPGLPVIYASILATGEGKGVSSPCLRGPPTSPSPVNIPRIVNPSGRKSKTKESCSPAGPPNVSPDACRVEDQIHGRNGRPAGPGRFRAACLPPWPPPRLPVMSINQIDPRGLDPGGFRLPVICPPHALPEKQLCFHPSGNTGLRELSHGSWTRPGRGVAIRRAYLHAQPSSHGYPHAQPEWVELVSAPADWAL